MRAGDDRSVAAASSAGDPAGLPDLTGDQARNLLDAVVGVASDLSLPDVLRRIDLLTEPYGAAGSYGRADQLSNKFISDELAQLQAMAVVAPTSSPSLNCCTW